jgi:hypothetical protein
MSQDKKENNSDSYLIGWKSICEAMGVLSPKSAHERIKRANIDLGWERMKKGRSPAIRKSVLLEKLDKYFYQS